MIPELRANKGRWQQPAEEPAADISGIRYPVFVLFISGLSPSAQNEK